MESKGTITPETYNHSRKNMYHRFTDEEFEHIDKAIDQQNRKTEAELFHLALMGLLQKLQTELDINDIGASKLILEVKTNSIDEMHNKLDMDSFYAGAAWYSLELAKACDEYVESDN